MATSSITKNFVVSGKEQVETFTSAMEASSVSYSKSFNISEAQVTDLNRIVSIVNDRKKAHG